MKRSVCSRKLCVLNLVFLVACGDAERSGPQPAVREPGAANQLSKENTPGPLNACEILPRAHVEQILSSAIGSAVVVDSSQAGEGTCIHAFENDGQVIIAAAVRRQVRPPAAPLPTGATARKVPLSIRRVNAERGPVSIYLELRYSRDLGATADALLQKALQNESSIAGPGATADST